MNVRLATFLVIIVSSVNAFGMAARDRGAEMQYKLQLDLLQGRCNVLMSSGQSAIYQGDIESKRVLKRQIEQLLEEICRFQDSSPEFCRYDCNAMRSNLAAMLCMLTEKTAGWVPWINTKLMMFGVASDCWSSKDFGQRGRESSEEMYDKHFKTKLVAYLATG